MYSFSIETAVLILCSWHNSDFGNMCIFCQFYQICSNFVCSNFIDLFNRFFFSNNSSLVGLCQGLVPYHVTIFCKSFEGPKLTFHGGMLVAILISCLCWAVSLYYTSQFSCNLKFFCLTSLYSTNCCNLYKDSYQSLDFDLIIWWAPLCWGSLLACDLNTSVFSLILDVIKLLYLFVCETVQCFMPFLKA